MQLKIYSIRDGKAEYYNRPFFEMRKGEAERNFAELTNDEKSILNQYPDDFDLYHIGEFDDQTGVLTPLKTPSHVLKAISVKRPAVN